MNVKGKCLCGSVKLSAEIKTKDFDTCHCSMCRKWGGGPLFAIEIEGEIQFDSHDHVSVYDSSDWAQRGFCSKCGAHLFYRLKNGSYCNIPPGLLEDLKDINFVKQVYVDHKPSYYDFSNKTEMLTEKDVLSAFGIA